MKYMGWSCADLDEAPREIVDEIIKIMIEQQDA